MHVCNITLSIRFQPGEGGTKPVWGGGGGGGTTITRLHSDWVHGTEDTQDADVYRLSCEFKSHYNLPIQPFKVWIRHSFPNELQFTYYQLPRARCT